MSKAIVVTSGKGGVGKTTVTANIGYSLALIGKKVVLVDTDIGLRNLDVMMGLESKIIYNLVDVTDGICELSQALIKDTRLSSDLYLLPASQSRHKEDVSFDQMKIIISLLKKNFDYVIIDCPAGIEHGFANAVHAADSAIIVVTPEVTSVRDADRVLGLLENFEITDTSLIVNRVQPHMVNTGRMMTVDQITDLLGIKLLGVIPEDNNVIACTNKGEPVVLKGRTPAVKAYSSIVSRLEGNDEPMGNLGKKGFWSKLSDSFGR
ncbi:MAG: septum site-determining protein MinD [Caldisericia bacterium]|nr:septum site-determining protein MinD [Caldisericia bacterium]